jgi:hypothetical protein
MQSGSLRADNFRDVRYKGPIGCRALGFDTQSIPMPLSHGDNFGPYKILSPLGAGGMGGVYKARAESSEHLRALRRGAELPRDGVRRERGNGVPDSGRSRRSAPQGIACRGLKPANVMVAKDPTRTGHAGQQGHDGPRWHP